MDLVEVGRDDVDWECSTNGVEEKCRRLKFSYKSILPCTARVFRRDSPGKAVQWLARSIRES
jgi:hypothetical protein